MYIPMAPTAQRPGKGLTLRLLEAAAASGVPVPPVESPLPNAVEIRPYQSLLPTAGSEKKAYRTKAPPQGLPLQTSRAHLPAPLLERAHLQRRSASTRT